MPPLKCKAPTPHSACQGSDLQASALPLEDSPPLVSLYSSLTVPTYAPEIESARPARQGSAPCPRINACNRQRGRGGPKLLTDDHTEKALARGARDYLRLSGRQTLQAV